MSDELDHSAISNRRTRRWMIVLLSVFVGVAALLIMRVLVGAKAT